MSQPFYNVPRFLANGRPPDLMPGAISYRPAVAEDPRTNVTERIEPLKPQPCNQLPADARNMLVRASQIPDVHGRRIAIDTAIDFVRLSFPTFFRHPQPEKD